MNKNSTQSQNVQANTPALKSFFSRENVEAVLIAVVLALFIRTFVIQAFKIPSGSMLETIQLGDHILVNKFIYGVKIPFTDKTLIPVKDPKRGDIIVFKPPHEPKIDYIKRVVGIEGDEIEIRNKKLYVNGEHVTGAYEIHTDSRMLPASISNRDNYGPVTVPEDCLFMMGDNRDNSLDSRFWKNDGEDVPFVHLDEVKGEAMFIYWSWDSEEFGVRWGRLGHWLK